MLTVPPSQSLRLLHFDIETRRVGFFSAGKFAPDGCEPIAIACSWADNEDVHSTTLAIASAQEMLSFFRSFWDEAGIVSGHYIRKFDLPVIQGALLENGLPPLTSKLTSDTKLDLYKRGGISVSQENLAAMLGLAEQKLHMGDHYWRQSSRLTPEGIEAARKRAESDVRQNKELRAGLLEQRWLRPTPRLWRP